jgi:hypothetical protein
LLGAKFDVDAGLGACPFGWTGTIALGESLRAIAVLESGASNSGMTHGGVEVDVVASSMRLVQVTIGTENLPREAEIQSHLACYPVMGSRATHLIIVDTWDCLRLHKIVTYKYERLTIVLGGELSSGKSAEPRDSENSGTKRTSDEYLAPTV